MKNIPRSKSPGWKHGGSPESMIARGRTMKRIGATET